MANVLDRYTLSLILAAGKICFLEKLLQNMTAEMENKSQRRKFNLHYVYIPSQKTSCHHQPYTRYSKLPIQVKYLEFHLDRRLIRKTHIKKVKKRK